MITLYSTGCPLCKILEQRLKQKHIDFAVIYGEEPIIKLGLSYAPVLNVGQKYYNFAEAMAWMAKPEMDAN